MKHHVGIGGVLEVAEEIGVAGVVGGVFHHPRIQGVAGFGVSLITDRAHPTVAIGGGAFTEMEFVEHSVTVEPVVTPIGRLVLGVGPVADVETIEVVGNLSDYLKIFGRDLGVNRGIPIEKVGVVLSVQREVEGVITDCGHCLALLA